jgi:hypothetical protein
MTISAMLLDEILASRRWTQKDAQTVLAALEASGLSLPAFAARHKVQAQRIALWRQKLGSPGKTTRPPAPVSFVKVGPPPTALPSFPCRYELRLAGGDTLCIEGALDASTVRTLLALLRAGPAC